MRSLKRGKYLVEVMTSLVERQSAQPVIAAKFDDDGFRVKTQNRRKAADSVLGGGSAGSLIDDLVVVALRIELPLQRIGKRLAFRQAEAGGNTVAETHQDMGWDMSRCSRKKARQHRQAN